MGGSQEAIRAVEAEPAGPSNRNSVGASSADVIPWVVDEAIASRYAPPDSPTARKRISVNRAPARPSLTSLDPSHEHLHATFATDQRISELAKQHRAGF